MNRNAFRRHTSRLILAAAAVLAAWAPLGASVVVLMNLEELVDASDSIVQAVVEHVESRWEDRQIFTYIAVRIDEPLKGNRTRTLMIRQLGGQVGSLVATVPGMPEFEAGDQVIIFLKDSADGTFQVVGMNQGRYVIAENYAVSNLSGVDLMNPKNGVVTGMSRVRRVQVEEFKDRIRELVR